MIESRISKTVITAETGVSTKIFVAAANCRAGSKIVGFVSGEYMLMC